MSESRNDITGLSYTENRQIKSFVTIDRQDAILALEILSQPREARIATGMKLANALDVMKAKKQINPKQTFTIQCEKRTPSGTVIVHTQPIKYRLAVFLMMACASKNEPGIEMTRRQLADFINGKPMARISGFTPTEFQKKIIV